MSIESRIMDAVSDLVPDVSPLRYTGSAKEYVIFNYDMIPSVYAESTANIARYSVQLHWYTPHGKNPITKRKAICRAIKAGGFTYPSVVNASDSDGQHYVFEFEGTDGNV